MFEKADPAPEQVPPKVHEQRIILFDFHQGVLASQSFTSPSLIIDRQPLDERGMPGITTEARANRVDSRHHLGIPHFENISKVYDEISSMSGYVLSVVSPINFRNFTLKRFDLNEVAHMAVAEAHLGHETPMDIVDAKLILASFALDKVRSQIPARYQVG